MIHKRTGIKIPYFLSIIFFSLSYLFSGYSQATSNVVVVQPGFQLCQQFRETSVRITCPSCRADVLTSTHYEAGTFTWVACLIIAFVGYVFLYLNTPLLEFQRPLPMYNSYRPRVSGRIQHDILPTFIPLLQPLYVSNYILVYFEN